MEDLCAASLTSNMTETKIYLFIFNLENVIETLGDSLIPGTSVDIQCNLDLVTLLVPAKTVTKSHNVAKSNAFM